MSHYLVKRVLMMLLTLWIIVTLTFSLMHAIPGDPFASESDQLPEQILANLRAKYNLDEPLPVQYVLYLKNLVMLDLGPSIKSDTRGVNDMIADGFSASATLGAQAIVIAIFFGITFGIIAALNRNKWLDYAAMAIAVLGIAIPSFIMAPLLINFLRSSFRSFRSQRGAPGCIRFCRRSPWLSGRWRSSPVTCGPA